MKKKKNLGENPFFFVFFLSKIDLRFFLCPHIPRKVLIFFCQLFLWKNLVKHIFQNENIKKIDCRQKKMFFQKLCKLCWKNCFGCQTIILGRKIDFSICVFFCRLWLRALSSHGWSKICIFGIKSRFLSMNIGQMDLYFFLNFTLQETKNLKSFKIHLTKIDG